MFQLCCSYVAVCTHSLTHSPVWELLFGRTLSKSCWRMKSSPGPSWFFCTPHRPAKTKCSPHCTPTSGTPEKLSVRLAKKNQQKSTTMNLLCVCKVKDSHLCSWGVCPQIHSKSRHHPADPWESNTIYPWTEDHNQSLTKFLRELGGHGSRPEDSFIGLNVCFREIQTKIGVQLTAIEKLLDTFHMASDWQRSNQICSNSLYRHRLVSSVREVPGRLKMGSWFFGNEGSQVTGRI